MNSHKVALQTMVLFTSVAAFVAGCGGDSVTSDQGILASYTVVRGDLDITITEGGSLSSAEATGVVARTEGRVTSVVADGSEVQEGDVLLELENSDLTDRLDKLRLERDEALRDQERAQVDLKLHELESAKRLADVERELRFAKMELEQFEKATGQLGENELLLKVERAKVVLERQRERLAIMPTMLEEGFVTKAELESVQLSVKELEQDLETAQQNLGVYQNFDRPKKLAGLQADVSAAEIQLERERQGVAATRSQKEADIKKHQFTAERKAGKIEEVEEHIRNLVIKAPRRGIVVHGNPDHRRWWNEQEDLNVGDEVYENRTVMSLPDLTDMICEVGINEFYIDKVREGMRTQTRIDSLGVTYSGQIRKLAATAEDRFGVKEYTAEVTLEDTDGREFRPGLSARVTVMIDSLQDVLTVPLDAVYERDGETYVYQDSGGEPERTAVDLGPSNDHFVVIESGLSEGDVVMVLAIEPGDA